MSDRERHLTILGGFVADAEAVGRADASMSRCGVMSPSPLQKLLYLGGSKAPPGGHRDWIAQVLAGSDRRRLGFLLAIPNAAVMTSAGLLMLAVLRDALGVILLAGAGFVLISGALIPAVTDRRAKSVSAKNGLSPHP